MTFTRRMLAALIAALLALSLTTAYADAVAQYDMSAPQNLTGEHLYAQSALLVDAQTGEVLFSKNARVRMYPASTTKIMTLLLALESGIALDSEVTIPKEAADIPEGSSVIPVQPGDVTPFIDLLYGFMLSSGNDGANAVAVLVDGSIDAFVARMNARARELGCDGTHYVNAHGYHDAEHYTTAQDLAVIAREAMKNEVFRQIVAAPAYTMQITSGGTRAALEIISRNSLLQSGEKYYYPECTGIKTGHHRKAGWCFVGSAERDGMRVICVVLGCENENDKWYDAAKLFEYGFTRYEPVALSALLERGRERFARVQLEDVDTGDPDGGSLLLDLGEIEGGEQALQIVSGSEAAMDAAIGRVAQAVTVEWDRPLAAPVAAGERMGTLTLQTEDGARVTAALSAPRDVAAKPTAAPTDAPTPVPTAIPEATAPAQQSAATGGGNAIWIAAALVALLCVACIALSVKLRADAKKRRRAARRRAAKKR